MVSIQVALTNIAPMLNSKTQMTMAPLTVQCFPFISHLARPRGCGHLHKLVEPGCQVNQIQPCQKAAFAQNVLDRRRNLALNGGRDEN